MNLEQHFAPQQLDIDETFKVNLASGAESGAFSNIFFIPIFQYLLFPNIYFKSIVSFLNLP